MSNISDLDVNLKDHCHEEADTSIVLHSLDVAKRNPFSDLVVYCCDTDVLLLLLHYFDNLCSSSFSHNKSRHPTSNNYTVTLVPSVAHHFLVSMQSRDVIRLVNLLALPRKHVGKC